MAFRFTRKWRLYGITLSGSDAVKGNGFYVPKHANDKIYGRVMKELANCSLIVLRVNSHGQLVNSKPCKDCTEQLKLFGLKNVYYSNYEGRIHLEKIKDMHTTHICRSSKSY